VLKIKENSLAKQINLISNEDFIIALRPTKDEIISLNGNFQKDPLTLFKEILKDNVGEEIEMFIYNDKKRTKKLES